MKLKKSIAISESGFVFDPMAGESFSVNDVGMEILTMLKEDKSKEEITDYFTDTYDIEASEFEKYFFDFVGMLKQFQLLESDDSA